MRDGDFELIILDSNDKPYPERFLNDRWIVESVCGAAFQVQVKVYQQQLPISTFYKCVLWIDGKENMIHNNIEILPGKDSTDTVFSGFVTEEGRFEFLFNKLVSTSTCGSVSSAENQNQFGTITVVIYEAIPTSEWIELLFSPVKVKVAEPQDPPHSKQAFPRDKAAVSHQFLSSPLSVLHSPPIATAPIIDKQPPTVCAPEIYIDPTVDSKKFWEVPAHCTTMGKKIDGPDDVRRPKPATPTLPRRKMQLPVTLTEMFFGVVGDEIPSPSKTSPILNGMKSSEIRRRPNSRNPN
jgi:hypothetical protein